MNRPATSPMDGLQVMDELPLVCRAQRGDTLAFDELTRRVRPKLLHWLRQRTGCWADAEDIAQQALLRAFKYIDQHDLQRPFSVWLYKIASRVAIDHAQRTRPETGLDTHALADKGDADPQRSAVEGETRENLWSIARHVLSESQYSALWLRYAEDMPIDDVAAVLGRTRISIRVLLHRARRRLAPCVQALADSAEIEPASQLGETT